MKAKTTHCLQTELGVCLLRGCEDGRGDLNQGARKQVQAYSSTDELRRAREIHRDGIEEEHGEGVVGG